MCSLFFSFFFELVHRIQSIHFLPTFFSNFETDSPIFFFFFFFFLNLTTDSAKTKQKFLNILLFCATSGQSNFIGLENIQFFFVSSKLNWRWSQNVGNGGFLVPVSIQFLCFEFQNIHKLHDLNSPLFQLISLNRMAGEIIKTKILGNWWCWLQLI